MKRYLIRSGIAPDEIKKPEEMILNNLIGGNIGNLIYAYSIYRNLMTEDVEIVPDRYRINEEDADMINKNYDAYIIPLADAFRDTFVGNLKKYTKLFKKLTIPVIVIGVGVKAPLNKRIKDGFPYDKEVKDFVNAVLERSSIIGVRGQITADYLSYLGFTEGVDHTVIGCPSMYTFGRDLKIKDLNLSEKSTIALNSSKLAPEHVLKFITKFSDQYPDYYFIPQWMKEFQMTYIGNEKLTADTPFYPNTIEDKYYQENRVRFPLNAKSWIDFMKEMDFAVGARLHGNITATIAGTPSLLLTKDARMKELAEYHNLTHLSEDQLTNDVNIEDIIKKLDFHSPEKVQAQNFDHFIEFIEKNGLDHIYNYDYYKNPPLDKKIENASLPGMLNPINDLTPIEISNRVAGYTKLEQEKISELRKSNKQQKEKISKLKKNNKVLSRQIKQSDGFKEQGKNTVLKSLGKTAKRIKKQLQKR
ncbi:polysaccharide pyruvyl transferase family protein [Bacillus altitudinis]|uniref:polysaccharide pyruvyl transferase family protein n=1 Tax=Bacillus altitudinis TaxID=293387 RepID=UPI0002BFF647|nr:polysaccharide pyruvyl transferase family protein [Bacillus altitudinis]EMI11905.1 polysaccharide pyruvyl transferase [Bacillus stratosphericus LAMA 585]MBU8855717.1 polysaccharide pyruvyl transferase family protein [Bacillus sp. FJAT-26377]MBR0630029.1 polysaccharide pyruvyl transferase family protein [Bacillus altitudinis S70-5-12]MDH3110887.1 polysaccharide pyruvyl transferase family protein [Bacillus altitudinis]MDH3110894.1 polysaccharide pyruvyl transferase family protein [Bacillus al